MKKTAKKRLNNEKIEIVMLDHKDVPSREGCIKIIVEEPSTEMAAQGQEIVCYNRKGYPVSGKEFDVASVGTTTRV